MWTFIRAVPSQRMVSHTVTLLVSTFDLIDFMSWSGCQDLNQHFLLCACPLRQQLKSYRPTTSICIIKTSVCLISIFDTCKRNTKYFFSFNIPWWHHVGMRHHTVWEESSRLQWESQTCHPTLTSNHSPNPICMFRRRQKNERVAWISIKTPTHIKKRGNSFPV